MPWVEKISDPQELRRCIRDLVALTTLPASWIESEPRQIVESVVAVLRTILNAEFIYATVPASRDEQAIEILHAPPTIDRSMENVIRAAAQDAAKSPAGHAVAMANPLGKGTISLAHAPIPPNAFVVAGSVRSDFPNEIQRLLISVGANEASVALQRWHSEVDKRCFVKLIDRSADFIAVLSLDARPFYINPGGYDLVGLSSSDDISRRHLLDFIAPRDRRLLNREFWPTVLQNGRWRGEINFRHLPTGESIPFLIDAFRIDDPHTNRAMNVATVGRDLRMQKKAESILRRLNDTLEQRVAARTTELAEAHQQLVAQIALRDVTDARLQELQLELSHANRLSTAGQMAGAIAHELNQPLVAITSSSNAAQRLLTNFRREDTAAVHEIVDEIAGYSIRAAQILRRLRDFVTRGEMDIRIESLSRMVDDAISFSMARSNGFGITVNVSYDPTAGTVFVDRIQVQQVLVNLLRNAIEAMSTSISRLLQVTTVRIDQQTVEIAITDSGPGLAAEVALRLFEPFVSTKTTGMGLGLSLCRSIVQAHGGKIRHQINSAGGATFIFTLPTAARSGESHAQ